MGDIIKSHKVRAESEALLNIYFDNGSPFTFIKLDVAERIGKPSRLSRHASFSGLGDGSFSSTHGLHLEVQLLDIWCKQFAYVVTASILPPGEYILLGHDFMQRYDIKLGTKKREVILNRDALLRAQKVY